MSRGRFVRVTYFAFLVAPIRFFRYQWAYFEVNTLGQGRNVYVEGGRGTPSTRSRTPAAWERLWGLPTSSPSTS